MSAAPPVLPDRIEPVRRQRLAAEDLTDLLALADHHRRRHMRALHDTWGIAMGLVVDRLREPGLVVGPGAAYDNCGRLLVVCATTQLPEPSDLPGPRVLVVRGDPDVREPATRLELIEPEALDVGRHVPLALLDPSAQDPSLAVRRYARRANPVMVAAGRARRGTMVVAGTPHEWEGWVDTERLGFDYVPAYVAEIGVREAEPGTATVQVRDTSTSGFFVRVRVPGTGGALDRTELTTNPEDVSWIAVLPQPRVGVLDAPPPSGPCVNRFEERRL